MTYQFSEPGEIRAWEKIRTLARECIKSSYEERPEGVRLKSIYEQRRGRLGLSRAGMDALLFRRMQGREPAGNGDTLKIRYWRTGHHLPANRNIALSFAEALELSGGETDWLLMEWLDKSRDMYPEEARHDSIYRSRYRRLKGLALGYLDRMYHCPPERLNGIRLAGNTPPLCNLRHLYYVDALQYVQQEPFSAFWEKHIYSIRYDQELKRNLKLLGEIPRKTMIRHLIILGLPYVNVEWMNEQLSFFGYLPLREDHTLTRGERLDRLLLGLFSVYGDLAVQEDPDRASLWFLHCYRKLDAYFLRKNMQAFRFMYFKSLEESV